MATTANELISNSDFTPPVTAATIDTAASRTGAAFNEQDFTSLIGSGHSSALAGDLHNYRDDGYVGTLGSEEGSADANGYVVYMEGLPTKVSGLKNGTRLYGGGLTDSHPAAANMSGNLLISGTNIALDFIYGGGFLTNDSYATTDEFNSWVKIEEGASFDGSRTIFLLGGSHVNNSTGTTTVNTNSELIIDANVTNAGFVCGGHGCYTAANIAGNSSLSISNGTYGEDVLVAGGSVLYINTTVPTAKLTQTGDTALTISGGTFTENVYGGNIFLYTDEKLQVAGENITLTGNSQITVDCTKENAIKIGRNIFAGSNGENKVTSTKVTFIGKGSGEEITSEKLSIAGYVSGDSSGRYGDMEAEDEDGYKQFAGEDSREIVFQNFYGTLGDATALYDFDKFTFENSVVDLGSAALNSAGETWNFSTGSCVEWNTELNFFGDIMILGSTGDSASDWTVFTGLNSVENFTKMASVQIFGTMAEWTDADGGCWTTDSYKLAMEENIVNNEVAGYNLVVSIA